MRVIYILIVLFCGHSFIGASQTVTDEKAEKMVKEFLGTERYSANKESNPGLIQSLKDKIQYGFDIIDEIPEKESEFKPLKKIKMVSKEPNQYITTEEFVQNYQSGNFNILTYDLQGKTDENLYFNLMGTNKYLVLYSWNSIRNRK